MQQKGDIEQGVVAEPHGTAEPVNNQPVSERIRGSPDKLTRVAISLIIVG
jgi:hypothetical protein